MARLIVAAGGHAVDVAELNDITASRKINRTVAGQPHQAAAEPPLYTDDHRT
ncbi:hypothetical protein ACF061_37650 [Streptomyces sp. NPDC015220]|uniref:hypothetical protein n=1 Tax=Streptomyces sp. NPDC015220 TaxID=3364947 RepID=UPI0036F784A3